jgi:predicted transcriptional regulator
MLTIRVTGASLKTARQRLGWSLQEAAARSAVNWLTIKKYEGAGEYLPPATVGTLNRLVDALEDAGVRFEADGAHLDRTAPTIKSTVLNDEAAA